MKAPPCSEAILSLLCYLPGLRAKELDGLTSGDLSEHKRPQHRDGVGRSSVKVPGNFSCRVETRNRPLFAEDFRLLIGRKAAKCIDKATDQWIGQIWRSIDGAG